MSEIRLAVLGATGGLGQRIVRQAAELTSQKILVTAIVRDSAKASSLFSEGINLKVVPSVDEANKALLLDAFKDQDIIIEVIDNTDRVEKVRLITQAVIDANVTSFIVCGGAGALKMSTEENSKRLYEVLGDSIGTWLKPVTLMHLEAQKVAFNSSVCISICFFLKQ
jgi:putative NADH-flavin reductase